MTIITCVVSSSSYYYCYYYMVAIFYPFGQFCEIYISLLSLQKQPNTAPNLFQRGVDYGKYVIIIILLFFLLLLGPRPRGRRRGAGRRPSRFIKILKSMYVCIKSMYVCIKSMYVILKIHQDSQIILKMYFLGTPVSLLLYSQKCPGVPFCPICQSSLLLQRPR